MSLWGLVEIGLHVLVGSALVGSCGDWLACPCGVLLWGLCGVCKPASPTPWTKTLWVYDFRTNQHFTQKTNPVKRTDLDDFVACFHADNRHDRKPTWSESNPAARWRSYPYETLLQRDKVSLELSWIPDESLEDSANLPDPEEIAAEIVEDLQAALEQFAEIANDLKG
jgi:type I restriction enzyme M protein